MVLKAVIDGTLLADCQRLGNVRYGMLRVAEEITKRLVDQEEMEFYFSHPLKDSYHNALLRAYLKSLKKQKQLKCVSYPFASSDVAIVERSSARLSKYLYQGGGIPGITNYDVFHSFYNPFPKSIERSKIVKSITLLDIIPLRMEGYTELVQPIKEIVECMAQNFTIAISEYSKQDLCDYDKRVDASRVFVAPLAADKKLFYVNNGKGEWEAVKKKYDLPENYFLSISGIDKRKNLQHLIFSFNKLVLQEKVEDLHLVLTGSFSFANTIYKELNIDTETKKRIVFAKPIDEEDLSVVYSNAMCFFFMSTYEGFGLPVLEAMQCGTPVVTSNATSIPEVVGDAGIMLSPYDEDLLSDTMLKVHTDSRLRKQLSIKGLERSHTFSWECCAKQYAGIFKQIAK